MHNPLDIQDFVIRRRRDLGVSQRKLAEMCGVSSATISRIENGKQLENLGMTAHKIVAALRPEEVEKNESNQQTFVQAMIEIQRELREARFERRQILEECAAIKAALEELSVDLKRD